MIHGDTKRTYCPVCLGISFENVWKIPLTKMKDSIIVNGAKLNKLPFLNSDTVYHFSKCDCCSSIFLNPFSSKYWEDRGSTYHRDKAISKREWSSYTAKSNLIASYVKNFGVIVDIACGGGQILSTMKEQGHKWNRMVGVEINKVAVEYINELGFEGIRGNVCERFDIDNESVDCVVFSEAFEHVQSQYYALAQVSRILKSGGILYMTAQALEANLPVRPEESVYVTKDTLEELFNKLNLKFMDIQLSAGRWKLIACKK